MPSFDRLLRRILLGDLIFLFAGLVAIFLLGRGHFWYPFALGVLLGALNLFLHAFSVRRLLGAPVASNEGTSAGIRAALLYTARFFIVAAVLAYEYLIRGIDLVPAIVGLLGTYAVLMAIGIMDARHGNGASDEVVEDSSMEATE